MKKVIITGVTGFFGGSLARKLLASGVQVIGVDIETPKFEEFKSYDNFTAVVAGFNKYEELPSLISDTDVEVFYHFAWAGGFTAAIRDYKLQMSNAGYAGDALVAAHKIGVKKFVYANTYNQYEIINFLESDAFEPRYTCIYSTGKTAAGLICKTLAHNLGIEYSAGLVPMPYGEYNYSKQLVNVVLKSLINGVAPKLVEGNNLYDLVYIGDIINAFIAIGENGKHMREYYVGHRELKTFREWMKDIRDCVAPDVDLTFGEYKDNQQIDYSKVDLNRLYIDTGFECKADFEKTMQRTVEWVRNNIN